MSEPVGDRQGIGAERRCTFDPPTGRKWVREQVVERDPARGLHTVEVVDGTAKPPFERVRGTMTLDPIDEEATRVAMTFEVTSRGPFQAALAVVSRPLLARTARQLLVGLDSHVRAAALEPCAVGGESPRLEPAAGRG